MKCFGCGKRMHKSKGDFEDWHMCENPKCNIHIIAVGHEKMKECNSEKEKAEKEIRIVVKKEPYYDCGLGL